MSDPKIDVRVYPIDEPKGNTLAFANISMDGLVAIRNLRVVTGENGDFVSMPQSKDKDDNFHDIAFPLTKELRDEITAVVLDEYQYQESLSRDERGYDDTEKGEISSKKIEDIKLSIQVYPLEQSKSNTKAFASVSVDDMVAIRGVRVVEGSNGLFVSMPQSKVGDGDFRDVAFPLIPDLRKAITKEILKEYKQQEKSLSNNLRKGAEKAAKQQTSSRTTQQRAAKRGAGALE